MHRYESRVKMLAAGLSALAGFVDAIGFLKLGGFFVSFMSGNTTRLAVGIATNFSQALLAGGLIVTFVLGVMLATLVSGGKDRRATRVLLLVAVLLAAAAALADLGVTAGAVAAMVLAMGAENGVFARDGEVHIGLTYMTGTLVKFAQHLTHALRGGPPVAWAPYLLLWLGLVLGAVAGAFSYRYIGLNDLWIAAIVALVFSHIAARMGPLCGESAALHEPAGA